ncbi:nacht and ankyrin domain containing protein [Macrophomina phaseolina MS6]|uniref:Nacht and ankyrin domain containing protein n=1 Tax=Macrophomina phaseolina (strain MS6) TaxID=1126212 RepID=K2RHZ6_MACPH|nr:nacht and ankyrin domain containing protein [Macrophomina phaseolina MS6]
MFINGYDSHLEGCQSFQNLNNLGSKSQVAVKTINRNPSFESRRATVLIGHGFGRIVPKQGDIWQTSGPSVVLVDRTSAAHGRHWEAGDNFTHPVDRTNSELVKFAHTHHGFKLFSQLTGDEIAMPTIIRFS